MVWTIKFSEFSTKQLKKMDKTIAKKILSYLRDKVLKQKDPRVLGKALMHDKSGLWRYRVDDYRIICEVVDHELMILVLRLGHRKNIYD